MRRPCCVFALCVASLTAGCAAVPDITRAQAPIGDSGPGSDKDGKKDEKEKEGPKHIRDNGFLVEEAFNQEPGEVQHIFNWINLWDRTPQGKTRDLAFSYTMELPLGSQAHQFSFTTQFLSNLDRPNNAPSTEQGGVGDTFLNYRYQLLGDDDFLWVAPRASLILPTGDERFGTGNGKLGYQFNLPVSRYGEDFDFHFNAGATYVPNASVVLGNELHSLGQDLTSYNLGVAAYWKPETYLHFFVELLALRNEELDDSGIRSRTNQIFVNPGLRYAICQFDEVEWVVGAAAPIGLTRSTPDIGLFLYMSVEHSFRKKAGDNGG